MKQNVNVSPSNINNYFRSIDYTVLEFNNDLSSLKTNIVVYLPEEIENLNIDLDNLLLFNFKKDNLVNEFEKSYVVDMLINYKLLPSFYLDYPDYQDCIIIQITHDEDKYPDRLYVIHKKITTLHDYMVVRYKSSLNVYETECGTVFLKMDLDMIENVSAFMLN